MKTRLLVLISFFSIAASAIEPPYDYNFFSNSRMGGHYFFSRTTIEGTSSVSNVNNKLPVNEKHFHTPGNSIQLEYENSNQGSWQATIFKQEIRGQDHFKKGTRLSFWIYNPSASTKPGDFPVVQLMLKDSSLTPALQFSTSRVKTWTQVSLPVTSFVSTDTFIETDFIAVVFSQKSASGNGRHTLYIDDIELLPGINKTPVTQKPVITSVKGYAKHVDITWTPVKDEGVKYVQVYRSEDGKNFKPVGIQLPFTSRYADFTGHTGKNYHYKISFVSDQYRESGLSAALSARTRILNDEELLTMVQEAAFRYYWEGAELNSGLAKENIAGRHNMIASGASGFGVMALIVGTERNFITRDQSVERFLRILNFLEKADKFHGAFSHFIDGTTGRAEPFFGSRDNGGDLVETSFLLQGLLTARAYFNKEDADEKMIRDKITAIWENTEWDWYRRFPDSKFLYWHWSPDQEWIINHKLIGWNETMVTYLLAIASPTHPVPASLYYTGWANLDSTGQEYRSGWGGTTDGSMYTNGKTYYDIKLDVGVSNGGPLFFIHYSYLGYDPHQLTDRYTNYFVNNQNIARINYRYCVDNPGNFEGYSDSCWGLTASDGPFHYAADEPVPGRETGKMAPTGAISSFPYTPDESMKALRNYYHNYGKFLWGEYGFRDAFNLTSNWCSEIYMGLNQAPMAVMIENYRTGLLWKLFMSDRDVKQGLDKLNQESGKTLN